MAANRFSRIISLWRLNLLLYLILAGLSLWCWDDLRWAATTLPGYLDGPMQPPRERQLYKEAQQIMQEEQQIEPARQLLEESIAIDPYGEGRYWLGRYYFALRQDAEAWIQFEQYLQIDPTMLDAYLKLAAIHSGRGEPAKARQVLQRGLQFFEKQLREFQPQHNPDVSAPFNDKAILIYQEYASAAQTLRDLITRLEQD